MRAALLTLALAACSYDAVDATDAAEIDAAMDSAQIDAVDAPDATPVPIDAVDATPDAIDAPLCSIGARRCEGNAVTECQGDAWVAITTCTTLCDHGACITPPSCGATTSTCGVGGNETCCASGPVAGGSFSRSYDGVSAGAIDDRFHATVGDFHLDRYEVTTARFDAFVAAYPFTTPAGAGRNPRDGNDQGWQTAWSAALPATRADLQASLACEGLTLQLASDPVRCVSWYVAQAFCIWDGGRLPTEAEWNYAAAGGGEQRIYPWSMPASDATISSSHATYQVSAPARAGLRALDGGRWGQRDLAGNVWEWTYDWFASPYPSMACTDCANHTAAAGRVTRGGSYLNAAGTVIASFRSSLSPTATRQTTGFRCARNPAP